MGKKIIDILVWVIGIGALGINIYLTIHPLPDTNFFMKYGTMLIASSTAIIAFILKIYNWANSIHIKYKKKNLAKRCREIICYAFDNTIRYVKDELKRAKDLDDYSETLSIRNGLIYVGNNTATTKAVVKFNELLTEKTKKDKNILNTTIFKILKDALNCDLDTKNINAFNPSVNFKINNHGYDLCDHNNFISEIEGQLDDFRQGKHDSSIKKYIEQ